jgi:hypothetical protein
MHTNDAISHTTALSHTTTPTSLSHTTTPTSLSHTTALSHTTMQTMQTMQSVEFDFENDDDAFYDFIEFGIASNGGRLSIW